MLCCNQRCSARTNCWCGRLKQYESGMWRSTAQLSDLEAPAKRYEIVTSRRLTHAGRRKLWQAHESPLLETRTRVGLRSWPRRQLRLWVQNWPYAAAASWFSPVIRHSSNMTSYGATLPAKRRRNREQLRFAIPQTSVSCFLVKSQATSCSIASRLDESGKFHSTRP